MSASSDSLGLFSELICGRCRIYSNKERYEYNNIKLFLLWGCHWNVKALCFKAIILRPNPVLAVF